MLVCYIGHCFGQSPQTAYLVYDSTQKATIYFKFDGVSIDSGYMNNRKALQSLEEIMNDEKITTQLDSIVIRATASPEGNAQHNIKLAERRALSVKSYLLWKFPFIEAKKITANSIGEDWLGLRMMVEQDLQVPYREEVLDIISNPQFSDSQKEDEIKKLDNRKAFNYIKKYILHYLRAGSTIIVFYQREVLHDENTKEALKEEPKPEVMEVIEVIAETPSLIIDPIKVPRTTFVLKTNLLAYTLFVANNGIEIPLGDHFSLDIPIYYSPYTLIKSYKFRVLATQPELRYWFNKPMRRHFVGLNALGGWYNIAYDKYDRYQDIDGATPAWGGGISYGYSLDLDHNWGLEFTAGVGYIRFDYDKFYNIKNGAKIDSKSKPYFGPTKLGINLVYKFNK